MLVIPSVDLMDGRVVRLLRGDPKHAWRYDHLGDPVAVARRWETEGAPLIHIVDLDAALGRGDNIEAITRIVQTLKVPTQVGGGVRSVEKALKLIEVGAERVVIGSLAFKDQKALKEILEKLGDSRIVVALDHLDGIVMVSGWREPTNITLREAAKRFVDMGVKFLLVTSIDKDGTLSGLDVKSLSKIIDLEVNIIASGGVRDLNDIVALRDLGVYGVIVGRALYEGLFSLREALKVVSK